MSEKKEPYELKDHQLFAASRKLWNQLRKENPISDSRKKLARKISWVILSLAFFRWLQRIILKSKIKSNKLKDEAPVFVVGHWRSGTTHLHYLLSQDEQFSHLGAFQGFFFNTAFTSKWFFKPILKRVMPSTRPQDNVKIDPESPTEDEHALVNYTRMSGMHMFFFPKNRTYFDKYNCFDGISEKELDEWKNTYRNLLKQIEVFNKTEKKLLLKNPHSTARVKVLSEMYPKAKFIFIHRNPYDVFNSTVTLYEKAVRSQFLQDFSNEELNEHLLYCYEKMMAEYIRQRDCLSSDRIIEVAYDDLVENPMDELKAIYEQLDLGKFEAKTDSFQTYLDSLGTYKKNPPKVIDPELKQRIAERWEFAFQEWGYTS